jgi:hypothetical protein
MSRRMRGGVYRKRSWRCSVQWRGGENTVNLKDGACIQSGSIYVEEVEQKTIA